MSFRFVDFLSNSYKMYNCTFCTNSVAVSVTDRGHPTTRVIIITILIIIVAVHFKGSTHIKFLSG